MEKREIKFRAFIKYYDEQEKGEMVNMPMHLLHFDYEMGWVVAFTDYKEFYAHECYENSEPPIVFELMQFTGLYDKSKNKVFEGDIVKITRSNTEPKILAVEFRNGCFMCGGVNSLYNYLTRTDLYVNVIGNIYENPELKP